MTADASLPYSEYRSYGRQSYNQRTEIRPDSLGGENVSTYTEMEGRNQLECMRYARFP